MKTNVCKTKSMVIVNGNNMHTVELNGHIIEQVKSVKCLETIIEKNGTSDK